MIPDATGDTNDLSRFTPSGKPLASPPPPAVPCPGQATGNPSDSFGLFDLGFQTPPQSLSVPSLSPVAQTVQSIDGAVRAALYADMAQLAQLVASIEAPILASLAYQLAQLRAAVADLRSVVHDLAIQRMSFPCPEATSFIREVYGGFPYGLATLPQAPGEVTVNVSQEQSQQAGAGVVESVAGESGSRSVVGTVGVTLASGNAGVPGEQAPQYAAVSEQVPQASLTGTAALPPDELQAPSPQQALADTMLAVAAVQLPTVDQLFALIPDRDAPPYAGESYREAGERVQEPLRFGPQTPGIAEPPIAPTIEPSPFTDSTTN